MVHPRPNQPKAAAMLISTLEMAHAQDDLVASLGNLDDDAMRAPSRCDGWSRAHVLTHIARNADGMVNLAEWAQTGDVVAMYESGDRRNADIEEGAARSASAIIEDVVASNDRVLAAFGALEGRVAVDPAVAAFEVRLGGDPATGPAVPVRDLPFLRLQEVVVHHHDLDHGLAARDWPRAYVDEALPRAARRMASRVDGLPRLVAEDDDVVVTLTQDSGVGDAEIRGPAASMLVWLLGRSTETDRSTLVVSDGDLPMLPDW